MTPFVPSRLFAALLLLCLAAPVPAREAQATKYTGLPETGQVDANAVVEARYGAAPQAAHGQPAATAQHVAAVAVPPGGITHVTLESTAAGGAPQSMVPLTFGQVFARGDLQRADALAGKLADGSTIPLQVDVKATHPDGSIRHAIVSGVVPRVAGRQAIALVKAKAPAGTAPTAAGLLAAGFTTTFTATIDGRQYSASADKLLAQAPPTAWLAGPVVSEWLVAAPLRSKDGAEHPHLSARFAVRWYGAIKKARVDVTVENDWAYEPARQNVTYDALVTVGGKQAWARQALTHLHHARWRKVFWWGGEPEVHIAHDTRYLIASLAVPNYDQSIAVSGASLGALWARWSGPKIEPMGTGLANPYMPTTGGRDDIGLLPGWGAAYLLSMDRRAKEATLGMGDLAGSWSAHYRDKRTGKPLSLIDYPYATVLGMPSDTLNPATGKREAFPVCEKAACASPNTHDASHQPAFAYLPYLVSGDYYYLEELQFWAMWNMFSSNPGYRQAGRGLVAPDQVRGQAWSLRTLAEAAYITPDADRLKSHFTKILASNLEWFNATYTNNPAANVLGVLVNGYALAYKDKTGVAPWQDDFFTAAIGHVAELGFAQAQPLLAWKSKFPVARMTGAGYCWIQGAAYALIVRDSAAGPFYGSIGQAYKASVPPDVAALPCAGPEMAAALKLKPGEMTGYSSSPTGFPSNMQPALAYAAGVAGKAGKAAWAQFMARSVKPDYSAAPQFAIVPR